MPVGTLRLVSTFAGRHDPASNRTLVRRMPAVMATLPEAPTALQSLAQYAAAVCSGAATLRPGGRTTSLRPCPATDFNAAGLLYFPSSAALADRCDFATGGPAFRLLVERHVVYARNVGPEETVEASFQDRHDGHLAQLACADGRLIARLKSRFLPA